MVTVNRKDLEKMIETVYALTEASGKEAQDLNYKGALEYSQAALNTALALDVIFKNTGVR